MSDEMISVPRELMKRVATEADHMLGFTSASNYEECRKAVDELRALLAKPAERPEPVAVVLPEPFCRQRLAAEGKPYPRSSCGVCGPFSPKWRECDALIEVARLNPGAKP